MRSAARSAKISAAMKRYWKRKKAAPKQTNRRSYKPRKEVLEALHTLNRYVKRTTI